MLALIIEVLGGSVNPRRETWFLRENQVSLLMVCNRRRSRPMACSAVNLDHYSFLRKLAFWCIIKAVQWNETKGDRRHL
jgi:hypothetical protein